MVPTNQFYPGNNPQFSQRGRNRRPNYSPKHRWQAPQQFPTNSVPTSQFSGSDNSYDKRKQDRRKVTMQELFHDHRAFANGVSIPTQDTNSGILLSDTQEFPGLGSPSMINQSMLVGSQLSYSDAVLGKTIIHQSPQTVQLTARNSASPDDGSVQEKLQAQKNRKRQKKAERASKAADEEYAEISEEQENIKKALKKTAANRNRNKPSKFDLGEILSQQLKSKTMSGKIEMSGANMKDGSSLLNLKLRSTLAMPVNPLDSTAPMVKRGKERENPKPKKPSALKKVILKEREEKKEHRLSQLTTRDLPDTDVPPYPPAILDTLKSAQSHEEEIDHSVIENIGSSVPQIHSRRYREYCSQVLDKRIDETCTIILQKLVQFQDRLYQKDPMKAKMRRRLVMGIREVTKHLKLKKLKCVIVSPNLEKIQSKGGLDDALQQILDMCESQNVTYVFALGRKAMGRAVSKLVPVSIVGIFDYSGAEDQYKEMCSLVIEAQQKYKEMVSIYQQEVIDATNTTPTTTAVTTGGTSKRFPHMGHSRNPSAASCVSFASFISEPISEMNEGSNWRAMMDAQEEQTTLSPPPEVESDEEPTSSKMSTGGVANTNQHEDLCRKDSGSTVVECKDAQHPEETDELPEDLEIVHDLSSSLSSIHEEASTSASKNLDKSFSNSSTVVVLPRAEVPPIGAQSDDLCAEKPIDEASEVQNRIQMWLENASRSVQDMNLDLTPPEEENGPEEISSPEEDLIKDEPQEKGDEIEEQ
uniref:Selenocysteine insertion sequence-binding protein 2-like n=1 Tax=Phallusia mammillata TaxID=59560 RepID=A0A6F9DSJ9_9ASCI|nr:selenocysteine insertion sequence-binding protein 2-like [Phallusia mammillata]